MKLTNEEIEKAREALESMIGTALGSGYATETDGQDAQEYLDALCAAARQDSLVGKRVRLKDGGLVLKVETVEPQRYGLLDPLRGYLLHSKRDDFEVLEAHA